MTPTFARKLERKLWEPFNNTSFGTRLSPGEPTHRKSLNSLPRTDLDGLEDPVKNVFKEELKIKSIKKEREKLKERRVVIERHSVVFNELKGPGIKGI